MTPLVPSTNTSRNVSQSSLALICKELSLAAQITTLPDSEESTWKSLFEESSEFFYQYPTYIQVRIEAMDGEGTRKWEGYVKSRIPGLLKSLEQEDGVVLAHINTQMFTQIPKDR